ncbi:DUF2127 domain-containing protein [Iamia majanohamensis]|uniref:DUF2127 domain-containing protein n=1 Tax=Iamia majanohamensis TaxID=467976 RepID=A0AAF0BST9_9ACTN|nr:DUF2127 domain-containing protein [Iamia majanohamensis]WCO65797.1 DUF2127 domain-containing protein [Iamia majanohamensis]
MEREERRAGDDRAVTPRAAGPDHGAHHLLPHRRHRERVRWDLVGCALGGHVVVGTDVATVTPADAALVRPADDGHRLHRCLRCEAWTLHPVPAHPTRERCPAEDEVEVPLRGRALRDRYVLKLIALERVLHVVFFAVVGVVLLFVARHRDVLDEDFRHIVSDLQSGGSVEGTGIVAEVGKFFSFSYSSLYLLAVVSLTYAAFEAVEAVGLWLGRRWAEYLTFVATATLLPLEVFGLLDRPSPLKLLTLAVNLAIVVYLLVSKRLFGLGRHRSAPAG